MVTYTADVSVKLRNVKVEARSEAEAEREIEAAVSEWMDSYVPLDPDGTLVDVYNVGEDEDYDDEDYEEDWNRKSRRSNGCKSGSRSCMGGSCNNCKSGHGSKTRAGNGSKKRSNNASRTRSGNASRTPKKSCNKPPRDAQGRFVSKSGNGGGRR